MDMHGYPWISMDIQSPWPVWDELGVDLGEQFGEPSGHPVAIGQMIPTVVGYGYNQLGFP